ncbi:L,D-transpeptidase [Akkermansiaceae bacterium]|nr:L,D-transpeptidase [Akkermansiaceae bacterium]
MPLNRLLLPLLGASFAFLVSCATKPAAPTLSKTDEGYVNPFEPGSYEHFKAEKGYPKTHNVWKNVQLLPKTDSSNSWVKIDLKQQRGMLMNGDEVVIDYPICSGTKSRPTPPGDYKVLEKIVDKSSNTYGKIYDAEGKMINGDADVNKDEIPEGGKFVGAPMRYWMRLTWDGVGHHIGPIRRYPASHACIRGPSAVMPIVYPKMAVGSRILVE